MSTLIPRFDIKLVIQSLYIQYITSDTKLSIQCITGDTQIELRNKSWKPECVGSFNMD